MVGTEFQKLKATSNSMDFGNTRGFRGGQDGEERVRHNQPPLAPHKEISLRAERMILTKKQYGKMERGGDHLSAIPFQLRGGVMKTTWNNWVSFFLAGATVSPTKR